MAEEEEVLLEVEAVQAVYGDDIAVIDSFPPHLHLHVKPRTADISSQQFVEALISIRAGLQYPEVAPSIDIIESKGLDEGRQKDLLNSIEDKALELSSCLMLVALCEAAVEKLSIMNHPDGECPLCLYPLVPEKLEGKTLPFMKLMSCFHCFHSECIIRWWTWLQKQEHTSASSATTTQPIRPGNKMGTDDSMGKCPVCRKIFHAKDLKHVLDLVGTHSSKLSSTSNEHKGDHDDGKLLECQSERTRREKFEAILKLQEESNGLIEPKKCIVVLPGMFLPQPVVAPPTPTSNEETIEQQPRDPPPVSTESNSSLSSSDHANAFAKRRNPNRRNRNQQKNSQWQARHWVKRENGTGASN